ncbi:proline rich transmembrane protein 1B-like [Onychostoma macrolepis]|nr:proline rich transmembrane protein 1B-like [Onychostoma macrolepis]
MSQSVPPPYYPNTGYQISRVNPIPSGYPNQPYGAPAGPQGPYTQQPYPGMSAYPQVAYVGQTGVTVQPTVFVAPVQAAPDYLCYSIFTMLFCCLPLGIAAVVYSCYTRDANLAGQRELAMSNSRAALILNNVALGIGLTIIVMANALIFTV